MLGYIYYDLVRTLPIGVEVDFNLWVCTKPLYSTFELGGQVKISFNREDIEGYMYDCAFIRKGIVLELI